MAASALATITDARQDESGRTNRPSTSTLYERTVELFSSSRSRSKDRKGCRPGRQPRVLNCHVFLLNKHYEYLPPSSELDRLSRNKLGSPESERPGLMETITKKSVFSLDQDVIQLEDQLIAKYPDVPLARIGFQMARVNEGKKIEKIQANNMSHLRDLLKKGKLWLVPNREILLPLNEQVLTTTATTSVEQNSRDISTENIHAVRTTNTGAEQNEQVLTTTATTSVEQNSRDISTDNIHAVRTTNTGAEQSDLEDFVLQPPKRRRPLRRAALRFQHSLGLRSNHNHVTLQHSNALPSSSAPPDIDMIEVIDSEDEELEQIMDESVESAILSTGRPSNTDINTLLQAFQKKVNKFDKQEIIVYRKRILESAFRALKRPHFDVQCKLYVKFSGELGMDHGGPRREFFRLAMHELSEKSGLFEGSDGEKMFRHNLQALQEGKYRLAGKLIGLSLAQEGPAMGFLNKEVFKMMNGLEPDLKNFDLQLIQDTDTRNIIKQLQRVDSDDSRDAFLSKHGDWMLDQGIQSTWCLKISDIPKTVHALVKQTIFYRTAAEIDQFLKGLNDVHGLAAEIGINPLMWEALFCSMGEPLKKEKLLGELIDIKWSVAGSNKREREEETIYAFELFLTDIEEEIVPVKFGDLLSFITGAETIPPAGFGSCIEIQFYDQEEGSLRLPFSSTCALTLSLPRGADPDMLRDLLMRALKESLGFGKC